MHIRLFRFVIDELGGFDNLFRWGSTARATECGTISKRVATKAADTDGVAVLAFDAVVEVFLVAGIYAKILGG
jgi:hypothetical protein